ncbi:MAG: AIR synthase family protein [Candidatus Latescibacteria bacterium]|jgi:hydrogenase maturation factor|nr:AIR synthase family protein [Candidatus Latescibacterota bacterium]
MSSDTGTKIPPGKLPLDLLSHLLDRYTIEDDRVIVGPRVGEDATVIDLGTVCLVLKTDPITFATDEIGYYAIHVNANDIATTGASPRWFLATLLLPEKETDPDLVESIFESIHSASDSIGVSFCGGHTEVTVGLDRPIVVGQMIGEVARGDLVRTESLEPGDALLLTKGLGVEATAILAREKASELQEQGVAEDVIARARNYLHDPGIGVTQEAGIACATARIHAMHDPTEGGVAGALRELAMAADVGIAVEEDALAVSDETRALCGALDLDPLGVISSGALLIGTSAEDAEKVRDAIRDDGIGCEIVGRVEEASLGIRLRRGGTWMDLPSFERDEIARAFE